MPNPYGNRPHRETYWSTYQQVVGANADEPITSVAPYQTVLLQDVRSGFSNPNWKRQVAAGQNATTPFTGTKQTLESTPCVTDTWHLAAWPEQPANWRRERKTWSHDVESFVYTTPPINSLNIADNKAQTRFYKELEGALTSFQGGVALGELRETLQLIRNPAQSLRRKLGDFLSDAKKRRRGSAIARRQVAADLWLEHSFGWLPLLHDLDAARDYHKRRVNQLKMELIPLQGSATERTSTDTARGHTSGFRHLSCRSIVRNTSFVRYKGAVASEALGNFVIETSALGLAPRSFVPTTWELIPWSFAIDYFTNIGDVLAAWSNQRTRLAWLCRTTRQTSEYSSYGVYATGWTGGTPVKVYVDQMVAGGSSKASHRVVGRSSSSYCPVPSISFEMPGFGRRWLNLAALKADRRLLTPY